MSVKLTKQDWDDIQHLEAYANIAIARRFERALLYIYRYRELTQNAGPDEIRREGYDKSSNWTCSSAKPVKES